MSLSEWSARREFIGRRADFYYDLAEALEDRSAIATEIKKHRVRAQQRGNAGLAAMFAVWIRGLDRGVFTEAIRSTMPVSDCMILQAFESSGRLADGLKFLSSVVKMSNKMKSTMKGAIIMPLFLMIFICSMLAMVGLFMVPILEQIYSHKDWPMAGQVLYPLSMFIKNDGLYVGILTILGMIGFAYSIPRWTGPVRTKFDNVLPYSIFRDYNGALFLTSLSALLKAGTSLIDSLNMLRGMSSPWMKWHISRMIILLDREAAHPAKALDTGCLPRVIADRIIDYGERSSFLEAMGVIGLQALERTEEELSKSAKTVNTTMLLLAGLLLGVMIVGVVLTSMHAQDIIRQQIH